MVLNRFLLWLGFRTLLIVANLIAIAYCIVYAELIYTPIVLFFAAVFQVSDLWRFIRRTNDNLSRFLQSIQTRDFTIGFRPDELDPSERRLHGAFQLILETIRRSELDRQAQYQYLKGIVEHIPTGIIALDDNQNIDLINHEAQSLLAIPEVANWRNLKSGNTEAIGQLLLLNHGESRLLETNIDGSKKYLSVSLFSMKLLNKHIRLFTLKDIAVEIDQKELEAWIKLTRVLTHEIMNSVTPLLSLTDTMLMVVKNEKGKARRAAELTDETVADLVESLETIQLRSKGLLQFVDDYRKFTRVPQLSAEPLVLQEVIGSLLHLMASELSKAGVDCQVQANPDGLTVTADRKLLEQVLINLFTNSLHALSGRPEPKLEITLSVSGLWAEVRVRDNGEGIDEDKIEQVFIPFYSTKKEGSGIGLSLSRQIIHRHKGRMSIQSVKESYTEVLIKLPINSSK